MKVINIIKHLERYIDSDKTIKVFITDDFPDSNFNSDSDSNSDSESIENLVF